MEKLLRRVDKYIKSLSKNVEGLEEFLLNVLDKGELYIIGGALRDIFYIENMSKYKVRDLDLIFNFDEDKIIDILDSYEYTRNRFGGYKIYLNKSFEIDMWSYKNNWALKNELIKEGKSLETISKGSFYNIDSLAYSLSENEVFFKNFEGITKHKMLDFVIDDLKYIESNPFREINIIRAFYYSKRYSLEFSLKLKKYITDYKEKELNALNKLYNAQYKHYKKEVLSKTELYLFLKKNRFLE